MHELLPHTRVVLVAEPNLPVVGVRTYHRNSFIRVRRLSHHVTVCGMTRSLLKREKKHVLRVFSVFMPIITACPLQAICSVDSCAFVAATMWEQSSHTALTVSAVFVCDRKNLLLGKTVTCDAIALIWDYLQEERGRKGAVGRQSPVNFWSNEAPQSQDLEVEKEFPASSSIMVCLKTKTKLGCEKAWGIIYYTTATKRGKDWLR